MVIRSNSCVLKGLLFLEILTRVRITKLLLFSISDYLLTGRCYINFLFFLPKV